MKSKIYRHEADALSTTGRAAMFAFMAIILILFNNCGYLDPDEGDDSSVLSSQSERMPGDSDIPPPLPGTPNDLTPPPGDSSASWMIDGLEILGGLAVPSQDIVVGKALAISFEFATNQKFTGRVEARIFKEPKSMNEPLALWDMIHSQGINHTFGVGKKTYSFLDVFGVEPIIQEKARYMLVVGVSEVNGQGAMVVSKEIDLTAGGTYQGINVSVHTKITSPLPAKVNEEVQGSFHVMTDITLDANAVANIYKDGHLVHTAVHRVAIPAGSSAYSLKDVLGRNPIPTESGRYILSVRIKGVGPYGAENSYLIQKAIDVL